MLPGVDSASKNEYQDIPVGKGGRCVRVMTLPPSCAECLVIWSLNRPEPSWLHTPVIGIALPFLLNFLTKVVVSLSTYFLDRFVDVPAYRVYKYFQNQIKVLHKIQNDTAQTARQKLAIVIFNSLLAKIPTQWQCEFLSWGGDSNQLLIRVFLKQLMVVQLVKEFHALNESRKFITDFSAAHH